MTITTIAEPFALIQDGLRAVEERLRQIVEGQHSSLAAVTERLLNAGGKRLRPAIVLLTAGVFSADDERSVALAAAIEMLHTATLVHDDLIDGSLLRRGALTLNADWSPNAVVLAGDYLFARAAHLGAQTNNMRVMELFAQTLMTIVDGEIGQMFSPQRVSRDDYVRRIYAKTAALFVLTTEAAAVLGNADASGLLAACEYGRNVGLAFQIVDDVLDFCGSPDQMGKPIGCDLRQGLFTLPAIYYIQAHPDDPDMKALLNGGNVDRDATSRVIAAVRRSGAVDKAMQDAREFAAQAQFALQTFPDSCHVEALSLVSQYIVNRDL
ncbi:MAG: polyprenyl synthetase family protein [Chloroflexi bacterium]|nr:polyprenyl synthetase family protein [Chloroflexota bacterium]